MEPPSERGTDSTPVHFDGGAWHERIRAAVHDRDRLAAVEATELLGSDLEPVFDRLTELAAALLHVGFSFVTLVDSDRSFWKSCFGTGAVDAVDRQNPVNESFCQYVVATGEPLLVADTRLDARTSDNPSIDSMGVLAWAGSPIVAAAGEVLGTFCVVSDEPRAWTEADAVVLDTLARSAASEIQLRAALRATTDVAAELAHQLETLERISERSELMADLARQVSAADSAAEVSRIVASTGRGVLDAKFVNINLVDATGTKLTIIHSPSVPEDIVERYSTIEVDDSTAPGSAVLQRRPMAAATFADYAAQWPSVADDAREIGLNAAAAWPMFRSDGTVIGALSVGWSSETEVTSLRRSALVTLAQICAAALERGQVGDTRRGFVLALQDALLPTVPSIPGLDIATEYLPANHALGFGGDWYDIFAIGPTVTAVIVGDVCGHGIAAAATMALLRGSLNALTRLNTDALGSIFDHAEDDVNHPREFVATVAIHLVDTNAGTVSAVTAGHPPSIVVLPDGSHRVLEAGRRPVLGLGGAAPDVEEAALPAGAVLVAYTDGLIERRGYSLDHGLADLVDTVVRMRTSSAAEISAAITATVIRARTDDIAYVVVKRPQS